MQQLEFSLRYASIVQHPQQNQTIDNGHHRMQILLVVRIYLVAFSSVRVNLKCASFSNYIQTLLCNPALPSVRVNLKCTSFSNYIETLLCNPALPSVRVNLKCTSFSNYIENLFLKPQQNQTIDDGHHRM